MKKKRVKEATLNGIQMTLNAFGKRFDSIDARFEKIDARFDEMDGKFSEMGEMLGFVVEHMVTKEELNEGLLSVQTQINGVERDIREMKRPLLEVRVADLEEKVFGKAR